MFITGYGIGPITSTAGVPTVRSGCDEPLAGGDVAAVAHRHGDDLVAGAVGSVDEPEDSSTSSSGGSAVTSW